MHWQQEIIIIVTLLFNTRVISGFLLPLNKICFHNSGNVRVLSSSSSSSLLFRTQQPSTDGTSTGTIVPDTATVLSEDPLIYTVPDLLTKEECEAYMHRVEELQSSCNRPLTQSNPPEVSIELSKLWPLPIFSFCAGIPPFIRLLQQQQQQQQEVTVVSNGVVELLSSSSTLTIETILSTILPPMACACLASFLLAYGVVLPLMRKVSSTSSRTSVAMAMNLDEDVSFVQKLVNKVSTMTGHSWQCWEAPVVTRYDPGAIFSIHGDASPSKGSEWKDVGGQRIVTCICYLNTIPLGSGGSTFFDKLQLAVHPKRGQALVFFPADSKTLLADDRTTHESQPATEDKWIVQMFGRIGPRVPPPLGLPDSYSETLSNKQTY